MKTQRTNSTFANPNSQADTSVCIRAIFLPSRGAKNKRTAPIKKQSFQLTNFCPFGSMTSWTWWKSIRIIIKCDKLSTFHSFVTTFTKYISSSIHKLKNKKLKTRSISKLDIKTLLATFLCRTNFHFLSDSSSRSSCSFPRWNKLSSTGISYSCRRFTHVISIYQLKLCSQLKGLEAYPKCLH